MVKFAKSWTRQISDYSKRDVKLPQVHLEENESGIELNPKWVHFGGGNLFRGMHAEIAQNLIDLGELDTGVVLIETFDDEVIDKAYKDYNNNILQAIMLEDGSMNLRLLDSISKAYYINYNNTEWMTINDIFSNTSLQLVTVTITEKGYDLTTSEGTWLPVVAMDIENGPKYPQHTISIIASLLYKRYKAGELPIALVTTDNFSRNGEKFQNAVMSIANEWLQNKYVPEEFIDYLESDKVTFPWTMVDRITPNPSVDVLERLEEQGFEDLRLIQTTKGTNIAPFVNTEKINYLVIEDSFPNGHPKLDSGGVILTDRETVDKTDVMKVTVCLNPLHTALAIFGCLLGYESISKEVQDPDLNKLIKKIGYTEGLPVVEDPKIINPKEFIDEVVNKRFPNPAIPDTPQRIASDTSQKLAIRYGETIKKYMASHDKEAEDLVFIPLVLAGWIRYLIGVNDEGEKFELSPDPLLAEMQEKMRSIKFGISLTEDEKEILGSILSNEKIFGVDLFEAGLADKVIHYFEELMIEPGSVRSTLKKYLS